MPVIPTRRLIAALAAAGLAVPGALGALAPATQAETKGGGGSTQHDKICDAYYNVFETDVDRAENADDRGDADERDWALDDAEKDLAAAQQASCDWALRVAGPTTRTGAPPVSAHPGP
jgi:hypothetical protein